jgi:putative transposase
MGLSLSFTRLQYYFKSAVLLLKNLRREASNMSIDFEGSQYPKEVILHAGFFYVRYAVSYRDFEEIMAERGVQIDHVTLNRWVVKYSPDIAKAAQTKKQATPISWRMDETDIKVRGKRIYLYRAIHRDGQVLDFIASQRRNTAAARRFFNREIGTYGVPERIAIDQSGVNLAGLESLNAILKFTGTGRIINIFQSKYLNNMVEQDHRFIKKITRPMLGFKAFYSAAATLAGIKVAHIIRKGHLG